MAGGHHHQRGITSLIMPSGFSLELIIQAVLYRRLTRHAPNIDS